jgi:glycine/D-amino acid oxidase-like deaminating enzyme
LKKAAGSSAAALARMRSASGRPATGPRVIVVGAGAFGGWTALFLVRRGARVTLLDAWGPGNSRASSGGETRVIRGTYADRIYTELVARAFEIWRQSEERWGKRLYRETGALWMYGDDDRLVAAARPHLRALGLPFEQLTVDEARRRWPQIDWDGVRGVQFESRAGYLLARRACEAVLDAVVAEGGDYRQAAVAAPESSGGRAGAVVTHEGERLEADLYVFACGPWLPTLFPDVLGELIRPTRQEVFFLGAPAGDARYTEERLPVWVDLSGGMVYGIPGSERRGFKVANDAHGVPFDPTSADRLASAEGLAWARAYVGRRFPGLKDAPILETRVCQYENSPDAHLILDRHPRASNVWLLGGGSGHGFKLGPALGERAADVILERRAPEAQFLLSRFAR